MTAEVVVMNKSAIALAADSKVTIGGSRMSKTYDTVNKLFTLSKVHPVGIMIYGNADFMLYPWETVIKLYRSHKGLASEKTVREWADDFVRYLRNFGSIRIADKRRNVKEITTALYSAIFDEADNAAISRGITIGSDDYVTLLKSVFIDRLVSLKDSKMWLSDQKAKSFIRSFGRIVDNITSEFVSEFKDQDLEVMADQFISQAILFRAASPLSSGIVIAGFGDDEYFPTTVCIECDGYVGNRLKIYDESVIDISRTMNGAMRAFAQREMVQRFMSGFDPSLGSALMTAFSELLKESCLNTLSKYTSKRKNNAKTRSEVERASLDSVRNMFEQFQKYTKRYYSDPIVQMISLLPKDELANLAESLVALTSLKRRVSSDLETVGGAIDVAIISKSDGFVWIKRKHYFGNELNPQFNLNYLNDVYGECDARSQYTPVRGRTARTSRNSTSRKTS